MLKKSFSGAFDDIVPTIFAVQLARQVGACNSCTIFASGVRYQLQAQDTPNAMVLNTSHGTLGCPRGLALAAVLETESGSVGVSQPFRDLAISALLEHALLPRSAHGMHA